MELSEANQGIDIISIHGMCTHTEKWAKESADRLSKHLGVGRQQPRLIQDNVEVLKFSFQNRKVTSYAIIWSALTAQKKKTLCQDSGMQTRSCQTWGSRRQAYVNNKLKSVLMNDCLADAIIYLGDTGKSIQEEVSLALAAIGSDRSQDNPLAIIAESLGSQIIYDVLKNGSGDSKNKVLKAFERVRMIYLAANQNQVLSLGQKDGSRSLLEVLSGQKHALSTDDKPPKLVAFTDPNDLLSYEIGSRKNHINVRVTNVPALLGLVASPRDVHTGYLENKRVWEYIMCGHDRTCSNQDDN